MDHPLSRFQTSVARREDFRKISITTVSENIFEFFLHELMSNILFYVYRKQLRNYQVSNLRRLIVKRRFETKISRNSFDFRVSISSHKNDRTLNFLVSPTHIHANMSFIEKKCRKLIFSIPISRGELFLKCAYFGYGGKS